MSAGPPTAFRLGRPVEDDRGGIIVDFSWWPHLRDGLFESFRGRFDLRATDGGTMLRLIGPVHGGTPERNAVVLESLVELLADALTADQVPIG
jgi:hypothetical protein